MQYSEVIFRGEWTYENKDRDVSFQGGVIPGKLSFIRIGGRVERPDIARVAQCITNLYESGLIDDSNIVRIVDFSGVRRSLKYIRKEYVSLIWRLNRAHQCRPTVTYMCGAGENERRECALLETISGLRYVCVDDVATAFERIQKGVDAPTNGQGPGTHDFVLKSHHLKELNSQVGALLFGHDVLGTEGDVSPDNPAKSIIDALAIAQGDLDQLQELEAISNSSVEDTIFQNRALIQHIPVQLWSLRDVRTYGIANESHARFCGMRSDEMSGSDIHELFPNEIADGCVAGNQEVYDTKEAYESEEWFPDEHGNRRFLAICKVPLLDEAGNIECVVCSASDITARMQAEEDLLKSKGSYEDIFNSVSEAIYVMSPSGTFLDVNQGAERMYGYTREEFVGMHPSMVSAPGKNDMEAVAQALKRVFETGEPERIEFWGMRKSGEPFPESVIFHKGRYSGDDILIATARDITDEIRSRHAMQEAEENYRLIVENTNDIIVIVDPMRNTMLFANESLSRITGFDKSEILGRSLMTLVPEDEIQKLKAKTADAIASGEVSAFHSRISHRDGRYIDVEVVEKSIIYNEAPAVLVTVRDISEQVRAERDTEYQFNLRQLMMELSAAFINMPLSKVGFAIDQSLRKLGEYLGADRSYIFNYDFDRNTTSNTFEYCKVGVEPQIENLQGLSLEVIPEWPLTHRCGETIEIPDVQALPPGGTRDVLEPQKIKSLMAAPLMEGAECVGFVGFDYVVRYHANTEDEKQMIQVFAQMLVNVKQRLDTEETRIKLSKAIDQNPTSVIITDREGIIEYVNPAMCSMTGYERAEVIGRNPRIFNSGHHGEPFFEELWTTILSGEVWKGELLNKKKNGELFWENAVISPLVRDDGRISHFVAVKENITARRQMFEELQLAKEKAEESDRLKSAFLANMSHEIRTPLNGIIGFASLLLEEAEQDEVKSYSDIICRSGDHLLNIINDIIHISKLDAGQITMTPDACNVSSLLLELKTLYEEQVAKDEKTIEVTLDAPSQEIWAMTDMTRLRQVLDNLLGNAVKFTPEGSICFGCEVVGDSLRFHVRDTGIGIPSDKQDHVFERFIQASSKTERMFGGTGLGLAISRACVELLGGHIWVESTVGKGSTFFFDIGYEPCANPSEPVALSGPSASFEGKHVLVVEDDDLSYLFLEKLCVTRGIRVTRAASGLQAIEYLRGHKEVDLVLMDIQMPDMDGWEATRKIRKTRPRLPIVAQTAYSFGNDEEKCLEAGCNDYVSKPITVDRLLETIARYL